MRIFKFLPFWKYFDMEFFPLDRLVTLCYNWCMINTNSKSTGLIITDYNSQARQWPAGGKHILAQYDQDTIVVYQAYGRHIGEFASQNGFFGEGFSLTRMSWIKPNFLWMMYRSAWGTSSGQEIVLAVRIRRAAFDMILTGAVHSTYVEALYGSPERWKEALASSNVRIQWDPDHLPSGERTLRRAIQLGLQGEMLRCYSKEWIVDIEDISAFVCEQREKARSPGYEGLLTPREMVYAVDDPEISWRVWTDSMPA
jgi:hypothetical protein